MYKQPKPRMSNVTPLGSGTAALTATLSKPVYLDVKSESAKKRIVVVLLSAVNARVSLTHWLLFIGTNVNN
jgi:hypothetical protein